MSGGPSTSGATGVRSVAAPLNETLAAGILLLGGFDGSVPFADPFCGSGTLCIEAALIATRTAPGLLHADAPFGFQRWPGFDAENWKRLLAEADGASAACARAPSTGATWTRPPWPAAKPTRRWRAWTDGSGSSRRADARDFVAARGPSGPHRHQPALRRPRGGGEDLAGLYKAFGDALKNSVVRAGAPWS